MSERGKIAVTGASGLVGRRLVGALRERGYDTLRLVRREPASNDEVEWNPQGNTIDLEGLAGVTGAVHLAGDNVAEGRQLMTVIDLTAFEIEIRIPENYADDIEAMYEDKAKPAEAAKSA